MQSSGAVPGNAMEVSKVLRRGAGLQLQGSSHEPLKRTLETTLFQTKLAEWLSQQCEGELAQALDHIASSSRRVEPGSLGDEYVVIETDGASQASDCSDELEVPTSAQRPALRSGSTRMARYHGRAERKADGPAATRQDGQDAHCHAYPHEVRGPSLSQSTSSDDEQTQPTIRRQPADSASSPALPCRHSLQVSPVLPSRYSSLLPST